MEGDEIMPVEGVADADPAPAASGAAHSAEGGCAECAAKAAAPAAQLVYAIGHLEFRFPSLGVEREYQQRLARTRLAAGARVAEGARSRAVLEAHGHLATSVCYVLMVGGIPAYVVSPVGSHTRSEVMEALEHSGDPNHFTVIIGQAGPLSSPQTCGAIVAPIVATRQIYGFTLDEWSRELQEQLKSPLEAQKVPAPQFASIAQEMFRHAVTSTENLGASDAHRALNYALLQHPGLFLAAAERHEKQMLERIEARAIHGLGSRRQVAIILTFTNLATGVAERLFTRIDVTELWPFVVDDAGRARAPLGLTPFIESGTFGLGI